MLKSGSLRHVTSRDTRFISVHDNRTPIGSKLPIMGEFYRLCVCVGVGEGLEKVGFMHIWFIKNATIVFPLLIYHNKAVF